MSVAPGTCKKQTNTTGVGGALSVQKNMPSPLEYGRTVQSDGLTAKKYGSC